MVSLICGAVLAAEDFLTGSDLPLANGFDLLPPSLDQSPLDPVIPDLLNDDLLNPFDSSGINLELFDGGGADSEWIVSVPDECSSRPFRSRRRNALCTVNGDKPYFEDFRDLADQTSQKVSNFDERNCLGALPYFVCSSHNPLHTIYSPKLLSWVLFQSSRGTSYSRHSLPPVRCAKKKIKKKISCI